MNTMQQQCPPWTLRAWPPLLWQVGRPVPLHLRHLGTQVTNPGDTLGCTIGQTIWAWSAEDGEVGIAWDWVRLARGVLAMADPMAVVSNLRLVGDEGEMLSAYDSARHFNTIVHRLPWQRAVEQALGAQAQPVALAA